MGRRLYVGNISYQTTELELRELFGQAGTVTDAKVVTDRDSGRPRGFAFVEMSSEEEARKAVGQLSGREVDGRTIAVSEAHDRTAGRTGGFGGGSPRGSGGGRGRW
jgi:RNA recognition motif-containing protein